jgi:hypothetical protein
MYSNQPHEADRAQQNINALYDAIIRLLSKLVFQEKEKKEVQGDTSLPESPGSPRIQLESREVPAIAAAPEREAIAPAEDYQLLPGNEPIQIQIGETRIAGTLEGIQEQLAALPEAKFMALHEAVSRPALPAAAADEVEEDVIEAEIISVEVNGEQKFYQNEQGEVELNELEVEPELDELEIKQEKETPQFQVVSLGQAEQLIQQNPGDSYQEHPGLASQMPTLVAAVDKAGHLQAIPQLRSAVESTVREVEAEEIEVKELKLGDETMRTGEQLTQQDQAAVTILQQIFDRPELQGSNTFEGKRFRVEKEGDRFSVTAKDGRGEILSIGEQGVQSRLASQDFESFTKAQQILQKTPVIAPSVLSPQVRSPQVEVGD